MKALAALAVIVLEPRVRSLLGVGIGSVLLPMMRLEPPGCKAIRVPDIVVGVLGKTGARESYYRESRGVISLRGDHDFRKHLGHICGYRR